MIGLSFLGTVKRYTFMVACVGLFSLLTGLLTGIIGFLFAKGITAATQFREANPTTLFFLIIAGFLTVLLYKLLRTKGNTDTVIAAAKGEEDVSHTLAPAVFVSSLFSHITGASVGREGAALQIGGSVGSFLAEKTRLGATEKRIIICAGMAGMFGAVFGTPLAAAIFVLELIGFTVFSLKAAASCFLSAFSAYYVCVYFGGHAERFSVGEIPVFSIPVALKILLLAALSGIVCLLFCVTIKYSKILFEKLFKNKYLRIFVGAVATIVLVLLFGTDYCGAGSGIIEGIFEGKAVAPWAFLLKILFTAIAVSSGFKGGEMVPALFVGATFGAIAAAYLGLPVGLCAAIGMTVLFCGITKCPVAAVVLAVEMFSFAGIWYIIPAVIVGYFASWKIGVYDNRRGKREY